MKKNIYVISKVPFRGLSKKRLSKDISNEKIESTGWKPKHSLDSGIEELIKGYKIIMSINICIVKL